MPVCFPQCAGQKYRPSNATEGEFFCERYCHRCSKYDDDTGCDILERSFWHQVDEPEYPVEWVYDQDGRPACTAYKPLPEFEPTPGLQIN